MKIAVVGGGPAGLYFSLLVRQRGDHQVTVFERNPSGATYGWGVVFSEGTLTELQGADQRLARRFDQALMRWSTIRIHRGGRQTIVAGQPFAAISRRTLLHLLSESASEAGVDIRYSATFDPDEPYDLVVAADGVNSTLRLADASKFRPSEWIHPTRYIWLGLGRALPGFTFVFEPTAHGLFWVHAYPYEAQASTFIVETTEESWRRAGLDRASEAESLAFCRETFAGFLKGAELKSNRSLWLQFVTLRCRSWVREGGTPLVILGDAAHTAHFSIGSGTKLAMEDALVLAETLADSSDDLAVALTSYEAVRRPVVERFQEAALASADYFAHVADLEGLADATFAFNLITRSGRVNHLDVQRQDPSLVLATNGAVLAADPTPLPPALAPVTVGGVRFANRLVGGSLGMTMSPPISVIAEGRHGPITDVVVLTHDGPRSGGRPSQDGLDRPLRGGDLEALAASPLPYTRFHAPPREATEKDLAEVVEAFARAAKQWNGRARLLLVDGANGRLLASFLSPLTNQRTDAFGGTVAGRLRFPQSVVKAVRSTWEGALGFRFSATDWVLDGITLDDASAIATAVAADGVDLVEVSGGGAVADYDAPFRAGYLVPLASRIRNRTGVPVLVGGGITTIDQANTIIAAGRADLVRLS